MAAPKQARSRTAAPSRPAGAKRDKGTRGGRPDTLAAAARPGGQPARRPARPARVAAAETAPPPPAPRIAPLWLQITTWVLALTGLGMSTYLTITHFDSSVPLVCTDKGVVNCGLVTTSPQSYVFGIPVAVLGLAFFLFLAAATSPWAWRSKYPALAWARVGSVVIGIVFVLYLIYTELFTLQHICLECTSVHVITFVLFVLIVVSAAVGYGFPDPDPAR